jgi:sortase B
MNKNESPKDLNKILRVVIAVLAAVLIFAAGVAVGMNLDFGPAETVPTETTEPAPTTAPTEPSTVPPTEPIKEVIFYEDPFVEELKALNEENPDIDAWIRIGDTIMDYPVAYTPDEPQKYDRMDLDGNYSYHGTLYIGKQCSMEPESDNLIIYGHNLENGRMFSNLLLYKDQSYWEENPEVALFTVDGVRYYKVLAAFYDRLYYNYEDEFEFYDFVDAVDEVDYNNAIEVFKEKALYDTGVTAEYGDGLLTLVTCSYHHEYGRFVVIAVNDGEPSIMEPEATEPEA